ncbi:hypothetical protein QA599_18895 [Haloarculaceae archaeon H-GB1-1]|nr:hypothetical protein [Haloarculaceae archaeon H-GB1-1]
MDDMDRREMPGVLVEEFLEREQGVRALLDELEVLSLQGDDTEVRERIRTLAETNQSIFFTVAFSLAGSKQFFGDVEAQLGVGSADRLRDLSEEYPALAEPFHVVRTEEANNRHNPVTGLEATTTYRRDEEVPLIEYTPHSGSVELFTGQESPEELLGFATYLVQATTDALDAALENEQTVNTDELSGLIDRREELESELGRLRDQIDELRRRPVNK